MKSQHICSDTFFFVIEYHMLNRSKFSLDGLKKKKEEVVIGWQIWVEERRSVTSTSNLQSPHIPTLYFWPLLYLSLLFLCVNLTRFFTVSFTYLSYRSISFFFLCFFLCGLQFPLLYVSNFVVGRQNKLWFLKFQQLGTLLWEYSSLIRTKNRYVRPLS